MVLLGRILDGFSVTFWVFLDGEEEGGEELELGFYYQRDDGVSSGQATNGFY